MGIGIFICSIPDRDFDTICFFKSRKDFNSCAGPSIPQYIEGIQKPIDDLAKKAIRKAKAYKRKKLGKEKEINALISRDGKSAVAVHFKNEVGAILANRAKNDSYKNYTLFIQNKPVKKYKIIAKIKIDNKINLDDEANTTLNLMLDSLIKKYESMSTNEKADGIITTSCVEAEFIKLE